MWDKVMRLVISLFVLVLSSTVNAKACSFDLLRQLQSPPNNQYNDQYRNEAFEYSVVIPKGLVGYDQEAPPHSALE
jgi:hypothetical protein